MCKCVRTKMADRDEIISQFAGVTGVDDARARFHLESAAWNLEVIIERYLEQECKNYSWVNFAFRLSFFHARPGKS